MDLPFDPAIEAQAAFRRAQEGHELGPDAVPAQELEAAFSENAGEEATEAYRGLLALGERHPEAGAFQEFLIYSTWQQATEDPVAEHFHRGRDLCARFLARTTPDGSEKSLARVRSLRSSFLNALGEKAHDEIGEEFDRDAFKGGD